MVRIDSVKFGEIRINGKDYFSDMVVFWDGRLEYRPKSHIFSPDEFLAVARRKPDAVVVGTGTTGIVKVPEEVVMLAENRKIKLFIETTDKAVDVFNGLVADNKKAVAVMHVT